MELSLALCEEITGLGKMPAPADEAEYERRRTQRFAFGSRASICTVRKGIESDPSVVLMRDISLTGIGFLHAEPLKVGTKFIITFTGRRSRHVKLQCEVDRCDVGGTGGTQYVIGGTFESVLEPAHDAELPAEEEEPSEPVPLMASLRSRLGPLSASNEPRRPSRIFVPYERVADESVVNKIIQPAAPPPIPKEAGAPMAFKEVLLPPLEAAPQTQSKSPEIASQASQIQEQASEPQEAPPEVNDLRRALRERSLAAKELPPLPVEETATEIPAPEPLEQTDDAEFTIIEADAVEEHPTHLLPPVEAAPEEVAPESEQPPVAEEQPFILMEDVIASEPAAEHTATAEQNSTLEQTNEDMEVFTIIETDIAGQEEAPLPATAEAEPIVVQEEPSALQKKMEDLVPSAGPSGAESPILELSELSKLKEYSSALVADSLRIEQELSMAEDVFTVLQDSPPSHSTDESTPLSPNKNQEVVSKLKSFLNSQSRTLQGQIQQLHDNNKQLRDANQRLAAHSQAMSEVTQKRNELQLKLTQVEQDLSEERTTAAQQADAHQAEIAQLREAVKALQAKSDADDKAIAELAAFLQNDATAGAAGHDHPDGTQTIAA